MATETGTLAQRRRKLFVLADTIGLTRDERIELSRFILWRDIISWKQLEEDQVDRLLDALEGFVAVNWMLKNRGVPPSTRGTGLGPAPGRK
jgi:hypothetical protein